MLRKITYVASVAAVGALLLRRTGLWSSGAPFPVIDEDGHPLPGSLSEKAYVDSNGVRQGMFLHSADVTNAVLLYLHGGMPAWWDRQGAGLSYNAGTRHRTSPSSSTWPTPSL